MILSKNLLTMCMRCWQKWVPILSKKGKYLITKSEDGEIQILLYNYLHLSEAYCQRKLDQNEISPGMLEPEHDLTYEIWDMQKAAYRKQRVC